MSALGRCEAQVDEPPGYWHTHRCSRKATVRIEQDEAANPINLCGQHAAKFRRRNWIQTKEGSG